MGKPVSGNSDTSITEYIGLEKRTRGSETSQYPQEEKESIDSQSSGERNGKSPNRMYVKACKRCTSGVVGPCRKGLQTFRLVKNSMDS